MLKLYPKLSEDFVEKKEVSTGEVVTADHANSKRYFVKDEKPTDDEGFIGDVCFVFNLEPPEPEVLPPFELITGYTVDHVGTSASLVGGQVQFEGVTSLSLNGVFSADFNNYVVSIQTFSSASVNVGMRMRGSGVDDAGSNYTQQQLNALGTNVTANRNPTTSMQVHNSYGTYRSGSSAYVYGPALAQPTAVRSLDASDYTGASLLDAASTHSPSVSYDGFTLVTASTNTITGTLSVYGVRS